MPSSKHGSKWTDEEEEQLAEEYKNRIKGNYSFDEISITEHEGQFSKRYKNFIYLKM
jgi:hypothetical protein